MCRSNTGCIGSSSEERGMTEGSDAAIAGDKVQRQHKQHDRDHARQQRQIVGKEKVPDYGRGQDDGDANEIAPPAAACRR